MKNVVVIGLVGYKQSGKTSSFQIIRDYFGKDKVQEIMLAGKLKEVCSQVFKIPIEHFENQELKEVAFSYPLSLSPLQIADILEEYDLVVAEGRVNPHVGKHLSTPRKILQYVGTEVLRSLDSEIHCKVAAKKINDNKINICTDIRFLNEYDYFENKVECEFYPLYIQRKQVENQGDTHASEKDILEIAKSCFLINSNETLVELKESLVDFLKFYNVGVNL